jgi:MFS family permease
MGTTRAAEAGQSPSMTKLALTGLACTSIEWYDFFVYGTAAALVFPVVFFPKTLPWFVALIASFSTFSVGFIARPVGAIIFGHVGDRAGRKRALVAALFLMGAASTAIGFLPSYLSAGMLAPLLLTTLRVAQGFAIGGQWGGAVLLLTENAPAASRGYYGGFAQAGVFVGLALANLVFLVASAGTETAFLAWGWRLPFFLSISLVGLALLLKFKFSETATFRKAQGVASDRPQNNVQVPMSAVPRSVPRGGMSCPSAPIIQTLRLYPKQVALAAGALVAANTTFYIVTTFIVAYGSSSAGLNLPRADVLSTVLLATLLVLPASVVCGGASDRFGRRPVFISGAILTAIWSYALFPLLETRSLIWMTVGLGVAMMLVNMMYGPLAALFTELFGTGSRYSAISLSYQIGAIFAGGVAPIIATGLLATLHSTFGVSVYITIVCGISLISVAMFRETRSVELEGLPREGVLGESS